jgi:hypothetical protein
MQQTGLWPSTSLTRKAARALINIEFFVVLKLDRVNKKSFLLNKKKEMKKTKYTHYLRVS